MGSVRGAVVGSAVLVVALAGAGGCRRAPGQEAAMAAAIGEALRRHADTVGEVSVAGATLQLRRPAIRLEVKDANQRDQRQSLAHFHLLATLKGAPALDLDACAMGMGPTPEARAEDLAQGFVDGAFPPILSSARRGAVLGARPFWGDEPWAVPGRRGYLGPLRVRGQAPVPPGAGDADFFSGLPGLPRDGRVHLLKVVLLFSDGAWTREAEVDGQPAGREREPWPKLAPTSDTLILVRFATFGPPHPVPGPEARAPALAKLAAREPWLFTPEDCPLPLLPARFEELGFSPGHCAGGRLQACVEGCQRGAADLCYAGALDVQQEPGREAEAQALYLRACRLGFASGCTNAAAGRRARQGKVDECSARTFERVCEQVQDPWACVMFGVALAVGEGVAKDVERARGLLPRGCRLGEDDPACQAAREVLRRLEERPR